MAQWTPFILLTCTAANLLTCWFMGRIALRYDRQHQLELEFAELRSDVADIQDILKQKGLMRPPLFTVRGNKGG